MSQIGRWTRPLYPPTKPAFALCCLLLLLLLLAANRTPLDPSTPIHAQVQQQGGQALAGDGAVRLDHGSPESAWSDLHVENGPVPGSPGAAWTLVLCAERGCLPPCLPHIPQRHKVNEAPGLSDSLLKPDAFCWLMQHVGNLSAWLSPRCWLLPLQRATWQRAAAALPPRGDWAVSTTELGASPLWLDTEALQRTESRAEARVVVWARDWRPLLVLGLRVEVEAFVLLSSARPLHAFLHGDWVVRLRHAPRSQQAEQERLWSTERLLRHLQQAVGHDVAALALRRVEGAVARTLLAAEARASDAWRCASCFQLLKFILTFNASLHPLVLQVNGHPSLHVARRPRAASSPPGPGDAPGRGAARSEETPAYKAVLRDSASLLCAATAGVGEALAGNVREILERHGVDAEPQSKSCNAEQSACLTGDDLRFLVDTHSESQHSGRFKLLFPSSLPELNAFRSTLQHRSHEPPFPPSYATDRLPAQLWEDLQAKLSAPTAPSLGARRGSAMQTQHGSKRADASPAEPGTPDAATGKADASPAGPRNPDAATGKAAQRATTYTANEQLRSNCSNDAEARGTLGSLALEPPLELWPPFEPRVRRYEARAAFPVLLLRLVASPRHCEEHVRIGESTGRRGAAHWPLGVGLTQVNVFVMAVGGVARVYTLRVFRDPRPSSSLTRPWNGTVCGLQQDCAFALWDRQPCGLRPLPRGSAQLDEQRPPCQGHEQGSWVLPCLSCADSSSCDWSQAAWEVSGCRHPRFSQQQLQQCMLGVKLLVVGDSTARGMMFYLMERLNGTLAHWEQIHGSKHYRFLNRGLTHAAFAYFPQFWVVPQHQRTFEETVMLLIASSRPLIDGWRTVLLLGGVHWLWPHHLRSLNLLLRREGLSRARVLVKTLSMGFGLPVESTRSLSLSEQRAVWQRNVGIMQEAHTLGFSIVDTWNVTVARHAEFLHGKCSCHFHEVIPRSRGAGGSALPVTTFHVQGAINAAYSEILLALLCSDQL